MAPLLPGMAKHAQSAKSCTLHDASHHSDPSARCQRVATAMTAAWVSKGTAPPAMGNTGDSIDAACIRDSTAQRRGKCYARLLSWECWCGTHAAFLRLPDFT